MYAGTKTRCVVCDSPASQQCMKCQLQTYCTPECFRKHQPTHKQYCPYLLTIRDTVIDYLVWKALHFGTATIHSQQAGGSKDKPRPPTMSAAVNLLPSDMLFSAVAIHAHNTSANVSEAILREAVDEEYHVEPSSAVGNEKTERVPTMIPNPALRGNQSPSQQYVASPGPGPVPDSRGQFDPPRQQPSYAGPPVPPTPGFPAQWTGIAQQQQSRMISTPSVNDIYVPEEQQAAFPPTAVVTADQQSRILASARYQTSNSPFSKAPNSPPLQNPMTPAQTSAVPGSQLRIAHDEQRYAPPIGDEQHPTLERSMSSDVRPMSATPSSAYRGISPKPAQDGAASRGSGAATDTCAAFKNTAKTMSDIVSASGSGSAGSTVTYRGSDKIMVDGVEIRTGADLERHAVDPDADEFAVHRRGRMRAVGNQQQANSPAASTSAVWFSGIIAPADFSLAIVTAKGTPHFPRPVCTTLGKNPRFLLEPLADPWAAYSVAMEAERKAWSCDGGIPEAFARNIALSSMPDFKGATPMKMCLEICLHFLVCQFVIGATPSTGGAIAMDARPSSPNAASGGMMSPPARTSSVAKRMRVRYSDGSPLVYDASGSLFSWLYGNDYGRRPFIIKTTQGEPIPVFAAPKKVLSRAAVNSVWTVPGSGRLTEKTSQDVRFSSDADPVLAAELVDTLFGRGSVASSFLPASSGPSLSEEPMIREYARSTDKRSAFAFIRDLISAVRDRFPAWFEDYR